VQPLTPQLIETEIREAIADGDTERIIKGQLILDNLAAKVLPGLCASALWYASKGLHVFPVQSGGKQPYPGTHGCKDAATDPDQIRAWWTRWPDANVGIATGHLVDVIDIDGPPYGVNSWARLRWFDPATQISHGPDGDCCLRCGRIGVDLPADHSCNPNLTPELAAELAAATALQPLTNDSKILGKVSTPRPGGNHLYVPASGRGNTAKIKPGIDYRGLGGYAIAPPSRTPEGHYVWYSPLVLP
jgi:hypothetical protein